MSIRPPFSSAEMQKWFFAIYAWDYCDPEPLAELIMMEPIPAEYRAVVAAIISGKRPQKTKAAAKLKITARTHYKIVRELAADLSMREIDKKYADETADRNGREPIEIIRGAEKYYRDRIATMAQQHGVSTETIENLLREMKKRFSDWPVV